MNVTEYLQKWSVSYRDDMLGNIMPFWLKHGLDLRNGGVYTCLDRDGSLIKELFRVDFGVFDNRCMPKFRIFARERSSPILFP